MNNKTPYIFKNTSQSARMRHVPGDPKKGAQFTTTKSRNLVKKLYFWTLKKPKEPRCQHDRVTLLWSCKWCPFLGGHLAPGTLSLRVNTHLFVTDHPPLLKELNFNIAVYIQNFHPHNSTILTPKPIYSNPIKHTFLRKDYSQLSPMLKIRY